MHVNNKTLFVLRMPSAVPLKTKDVVADMHGKIGALVVLDESHKGLERALRNIPTVKVRYAHKVLPKDIVECHEVWIDEAAMPIIATRSTL